jgi:hypothetical protein
MGNGPNPTICMYNIPLLVLFNFASLACSSLPFSSGHGGSMKHFAAEILFGHDFPDHGTSWQFSASCCISPDTPCIKLSSFNKSLNQ